MGSYTGTVPTFLAGELPDADKFTEISNFMTAGKNVFLLDTQVGLLTGNLANGTGTEVAIASANYNSEPTFALPNNHVFRVTLSTRITDNTAAAQHSGKLRIRKGAATISGTLLALFVVLPVINAGGLVANSTFVGYFKNTSGSTVNTKLSISIQRSVGANNLSIFSDSESRLMMTVEDLGTTTDNAVLASNSVSV